MKQIEFRNELLELDGIITKDMTRFLHDNYPLTDALYRGFSDELAASVQKVKKRLMNGVVRYSDMEAQKRYVLYHQQKLSDLVQKLTIYSLPGSYANSERMAESKMLLLTLNRALQDLFDFINIFFSSALPGEQWLPSDYHKLSAQEVAEGLEALYEKIGKLKISGELLTITMAPLFKFLSRPSDNDLTYHRQAFIKKLKYELLLLYNSRGEQTTEDDIHGLLFKLNFNSLAYLTYVGQVVRQRINSLPTATNKLDKLRQMQRDVSQIVQLPDVIFDVHNRQLKEYTIDWLQQEILFWESVHELPASITPSTESIGPPENPHLVYEGIPKNRARRLKTKFNLSVKVSALLLQAFRDTEIIEETDMKSLVRDLSAIFRSKEREFISAKSLYNKMSDVETSTATSLRNVLLKLVKHIETTYGVRG
jgi:hypothetical protein